MGWIAGYALLAFLIWFYWYFGDRGQWAYQRCPKCGHYNGDDHKKNGYCPNVTR